MPYVNRNEQGGIIEVSEEVTASAGLWLDSEDPALIAYLEEELVKGVITDSDSGMIRVIDDLVELLLDKQVFTFTELPEAAQQKLIERKMIRKGLNSLEGLIVEDERLF